MDGGRWWEEVFGNGVEEKKRKKVLGEMVLENGSSRKWEVDEAGEKEEERRGEGLSVGKRQPDAQ